MVSPVAKNATSRLTRCRSAGVNLARSPRSECRSTSSTVQVFLIASRNRSKNSGYRMGRRVRSIPGSRSMKCSTVDWSLAGIAGLRVLDRAGQRLVVADQRDGGGRGGLWCLRGDGHRGLLDARGGPGAQVVRGLQPGLPGVEVHRGELADGRRAQEQDQRLRLVDERLQSRGARGQRL